MPVMYRALAKGQPGIEGGGEKKYYATIVRDRKVNLRSFVEEIAGSNTLNTADIFAVLESFLQMTSKHLSEGRVIDMGQLGTFSPSIQSYAETTPQEVDRQSIRKFNVNFRPSSLLRDRLSTVKFEKIKGVVVEEEDPEAEPEK